MQKKVYVTGLGTISSIGRNVSETFHSLENEICGIGNITLLETNHKGILPAGEIKHTNAELAEMAENPSLRGLTRTTLLGLNAALQATSDAKLGDKNKGKTGFISATSIGGMDRSERFYDEFYKDPTKGHLWDVVNHDCGDSTDRIARILGITDFITTVSTACSSSANAIMLGAKLIKYGLLDTVVVGGVDPLIRFTMNGFNSLMILDSNKCTPFDKNRKGLNLGEGAAYIVLQDELMAKAAGRKMYAEITGYGNSCDAHHQTATSPDGIGPYLAMKKALEVSELSPNDIDYINAHGTGTDNNDATEGIAFGRIFGANIPPFSSTKSYTGHTLAASGAIEAVISILAINHNMLFPNLRFSEPIEGSGLYPVTEIVRNNMVNHVLSNSFGFGGNDTSLIFSRSSTLQ